MLRWWTGSCVWFPGVENEDENWPLLSICSLTVLWFCRWEPEAQQGERVARSAALGRGLGPERWCWPLCSTAVTARASCGRVLPGPAPSWGHRSQHHALEQLLSWSVTELC